MLASFVISLVLTVPATWIAWNLGYRAGHVDAVRDELTGDRRGGRINRPLDVWEGHDD